MTRASAVTVRDRAHISNLQPQALMARSPTLHQIRRGERVLFIERESGAWKILEGDRLRLFQRLQRPMTVRTFLGLESANLTLHEREEFVWDLYTHGMVEVGGKSFFDPASLWKKPQDYPTFLCLHMTETCNMACRYCQADAVQGSKRMSLETGRRIVERMITENPMRSLTFDFHGGEPLLEYDNMMQVIRHARTLAARHGKAVSFVVQTNGLGLTPERARELLKAGVYVGVSLDGPAEVHDRQRVAPGGGGTFAQVWGNIRRAVEAGLEVGYLAVIHDPDDYLTTSRWFREQGLRSYRINYSSSIGRAVRELRFPAGREEAFARNWLAMVRDSLEWTRLHGEHLHVSDLNNQIHNLTTRSRPFMCYRSPCGAGNSVLGFGVDGGIFACEEMASLDYFRVGNIHDDSVTLRELVDTNPILAQLQQRTVDRIPRCRSCHLKRICSGGCTSKTFAKYGTYMRESPMCGYYQIVYEELMWMLHDHPDMAENLGFAGLTSPRFARQNEERAARAARAAAAVEPLPPADTVAHGTGEAEAATGSGSCQGCSGCGVGP